MDKNLKVYNSKPVVNWYGRLREILPVEKSIFDDHKIFLRQGDLLDIGIGGGRTTAYLFPLCKTYTGIDYSESFVKSVKHHFPDANSLVMDARDLSAFKGWSFDFVNFSFNGIDYADLEGRKKILSEVSRVLKPGGIFFFSTHNKNHADFNKNPWLSANHSLLTNIKTFVKLAPFFANKLKHKKHQHITEDYGIINDSAHNYSLLTFYTSPAFLRKQLTETGFTGITFYAKSGEKKNDPDLDDWIFVTGKKISA